MPVCDDSFRSYLKRTLPQQQQQNNNAQQLPFVHVATSENQHRYVSVGPNSRISIGRSVFNNVILEGGYGRADHLVIRSNELNHIQIRATRDAWINNIALYPNKWSKWHGDAVVHIANKVAGRGKSSATINFYKFGPSPPSSPAPPQSATSTPKALPAIQPVDYFNDFVRISMELFT